MTWFKKLKQSFEVLCRKRQLDAEMDEEMRAHIEMQTEENIASGMNPAEARQAALRQFGGLDQIKEIRREMRGVSWLENLVQDVRYGARQLRKKPGFTAIVVVTLALGIGASTAIFSVVNTVLLRPLPYPEGDRLVELTDAGGPIAIPNFTDWKEQQTVFDQLFLFRAIDVSVRMNAEPPLRVLGIELSAAAFSTLNIKPFLGRFYSPEEDRKGGPHVIVLTHKFWQNRLGSDPNVLNKNLSIDGTPYLVLGVTPPNFDLVENAELMVPLEPAVKDSDRNNRKNHPSYESIARLAPGVSIEQAKLAMAAISRRLAVQYPDSNKDGFVGIKTLIDAKVGGVRRELWILLGAVLFVLLIACANVANLQLVRATSRRKEMAVRAALGAGHGRILRQMLTESVLLATLGAALGLLLARVSLLMISPMVQNSLPRVTRLGIDGNVLMFSAAIAVLTGILFGFAPAWQSCRPNISGVLNSASRGSSSGRTPMLHGLMITQIALSVVLLLGTGLLMRSFQQLCRVNAGFRHEQVVSFRVDFPDTVFPSPVMVDQFCQEMLKRLEALPGVQAASVATGIPIDNRSWATDLIIAVRPEQLPSDHPIMDINFVGAEYFRVLGIPLLKGRSFNDVDSRKYNRDLGGSSPDWSEMRSIIIDEEFSRRYFPNEDPIGKQIRLPWGTLAQNPLMTVVGVVGRVKREKLREENSAALPMGYMPIRERPNRHVAVVVKTSMALEPFTHAARQVVASINSTLPIYQVLTLTQMRENNIASERLNSTLLGAASFIALALAVVGIYGVVAFSVAQRQREIGIRLALGAQRTSVLAMVLRSGLKPASAGILLGLIGAFMLTRILRGLLFGVGPNDPLTFSLVPLVLLAVAFLACWLPASRATRVDPMVALRND